MSRLVMKFGGTSVADLDKIANAAGKVAQEVANSHEVVAIVSIIETCKLNKIERHTYLTGALTAIAHGHKQKDIEMLLPRNFGK